MWGAKGQIYGTRIQAWSRSTRGGTVIEKADVMILHQIYEIAG